ncbi:MAG: mitochondrial fission ELM1 family protein, partial [Acetobacteraceae bacterium]|nr:mitochondrial fission ELM1 family protein [Acetobacteraceae bacterium]
MTGPREPVWVLDDTRAGTSEPALGIAERLDVPFHRVPLMWNWMADAAGWVPRGSLMGIALPHGAAFPGSTATVAAQPRPPRLIVSAGSRSATVALWFKSRFGCRVVHCADAGFAALRRAGLFDLLIVPGYLAPSQADNVVPVIGVPHRLSPAALARARRAWRDRLDHLPGPRVALLVGGARQNPLRSAELSPALAHALGVRVARLAAARGGSVMATTSRRTGAEATEALAAGLGGVMHVL